jgi:transcription initiation factor TFIIE subunit alpha
MFVMWLALAPAHSHKFPQETQSRGWICPECHREYDTIQADRLLDMVRQCFVCEVCDTELEDNTNSAKVQGSKDRMRRFNAQMKWIRDAIRATEGIVLPGYASLIWPSVYP